MLIVICGERDLAYLPERKLIDTDWDTTVADIASGQFQSVSSVIQSSTGADVLPSIAALVMDKWADNDEPLTEWQRDFIDEHRASIRSLPPNNIRPVSVRGLVSSDH